MESEGDCRCSGNARDDSSSDEAQPDSIGSQRRPAETSCAVVSGRAGSRIGRVTADARQDPFSRDAGGWSRCCAASDAQFFIPYFSFLIIRHTACDAEAASPLRASRTIINRKSINRKFYPTPHYHLPTINYQLFNRKSKNRKSQILPLVAGAVVLPNLI